MFLQQEIYPTNDRSVPPQAGDVELLEGARLSKQIAARAQVSSWHDPEALGCASEFRLSRCCGLDALAVMGGSRKGPILRHLPDPRYYFNVHTRSCAA
jgi:hypothetical protein